MAGKQALHKSVHNHLQLFAIERSFELANSAFLLNECLLLFSIFCNKTLKNSRTKAAIQKENTNTPPGAYTKSWEVVRTRIYKHERKEIDEFNEQIDFSWN